MSNLIARYLAKRAPKDLERRIGTRGGRLCFRTIQYWCQTLGTGSRFDCFDNFDAAKKTQQPPAWKLANWIVEAAFLTARTGVTIHSRTEVPFLS